MRPRRLEASRIALLLVSTSGVGCTGVISEPYEASARGTPSATAGTSSGVAGSSGSVAAGGSAGSGTLDCAHAAPNPGSAPLRRLSNAEYRNTLLDLFASVPDIGGVVATATADFPSEPVSLGFHNSAELLVVQSLGAQKYMDAAEQLAEKAAAVPGLVGCTPAAGQEMTCAKAFIRDFGERAFRRPLTDAEAQRFETQFETALGAYDFATGVEWTLFSMLQSPEFLYRVEQGAPSSGTTTRPTAFEMATRLSYLLWQSAPDAALLASAAAGDLDTPAGIENEARAMLTDPRAKRLFEYFSEWLGLDRLDDFSRDPSVFGALPDGLANLYRDETKSFVLSLLARPDGALGELFTAPYTYANAELAGLYGLSGPSGSEFERVADARRSGVLTQAFLFAQDKPYRTSIVRRGLKVRTGLLCETVAAPPNDVQLNLDSIAPGLSQRDRLAQHRANPACAGCHQLLDPIGVVFENFDAVGRYRTRDEDGQPIVTDSEITDTLDANGQAADARDLGALLAASGEARDCYVTQSFRFFFGREVEPADACSLATLRQRFEAKALSLSELIVALTQTDAFLYRPTLEVTP